MSLVYTSSFTRIGQVDGEKDRRLAVLVKTKDETSLKFLPVTLSSGKVKYPICLECGTPVVWSYGHCRCGNLENKKGNKYKVKNTGQKFDHSTWLI